MKNIVVIGGTKGIGQQLVAILKDDHKMFVISRSPAGADFATVQYIQADATGELPDLSLFPDVIDGLVYCPGSINLKPFHRLTATDFRADWELNFMGAVNCIQHFLPLLKKSTTASILLFSTVAVQVGMPFHASISAAKGAIEGLTRALAAELAPAVRVNCIAPSLTNTPLAGKLLSGTERVEAAAKRHPLQRIGQPDDIAQMGCFLLSEKAGWITGQIIHLDGGMSSLKI